MCGLATFIQFKAVCLTANRHAIIGTHACYIILLISSDHSASKIYDPLHFD